MNAMTIHGKLVAIGRTTLRMIARMPSAASRLAV